MIRLIQRRLIIPRGDTGTFSIPVLTSSNMGDVSIFTIFNPLTHKKIAEKRMELSDGVLTVTFSHGDTVNLPAGQYVWDIKFYKNPVFSGEQLIDGEEIDSYYAAFSLPVCEIRETGDSLLMNDDTPQAKLAPDQIDLISAAITATQNAKEVAVNSAADAETSASAAATSAQAASDSKDAALASQTSAATSESNAAESAAAAQESATRAAQIAQQIHEEIPTKVSDLVDDSGHYTKPANGIPASDLEETYLTSFTEEDPTVPEWAKQPQKPTYTPQEVGALPDNTYIPSKTSDLVNDSDYAVDANYVHTDNNYTKAEKNKLEGIAAGAEVNVNADWTAESGDAYILNKPTNVSAFNNDVGYLTEHQDISGKADKSEIPTKVSQLQNDSGYLTSFTETDPTVPAWAKATTKPSYTAAEVGAPTIAEMNTAIGNAIGNINSFDMAVVQALPEQDISTHTIYLVPKTGETNDVYDEYVYINNAWEMVGNTQIDLSNYVQKTDYATSSTAGIVKVRPTYGLVMDGDTIKIKTAMSGNQIKLGAASYLPISPTTQHESVFYGLAKAAGDTTQCNSDNAVGTYTDEAKAAIQQMLDVPSTGDIPDTSIYATKADTVLDTTLSRGRVTNSKIGENSFAFGDNVIAAGKNSCAQGAYTMAVGDRSRAEGYGDLLKSRLTGEANSTSYVSTRPLPIGAVCYTVSNTNNYVRVIDSQDNDGIYTVVLSETLDEINPLDNKNVAFFFNVAFAPNSHTEGANSIALSASQHVEGRNNVPLTGKLQIIGNGLTAFSSGRSNAYALDEDGTGHYAGDVYVHANADSTGGTKLATIEDIPDAPVQDVQVNGTSVVENGVANVPVGNNNTFGVYKTGGYGVTVNAMPGSEGTLAISSALSSEIKAGSGAFKPITASNQYKSTFYGLAKAAGADEKDSTLPVGQYTDTAKSAIRTMLGAASDNIITISDTAPTDPDTKIWIPETATSVQVPTVSEMETALAGKVGDVQVNGTSIVSNGVAEIPKASGSVYGVVRTGNAFTYNNDILVLSSPTDADYKAGANNIKAINPNKQHMSTFYGLAKAAGDTTQSASDNAVGTYTDNAKASIKSMLGIVDGSTGTVDVSGATPTINAVENTRYVCGEVTSLDFTPSASGICIVRFTSGSTVTVLTLPSTVKFPEWFDPTSLEANTIYEMCITDGVYGAVMSWPL